MVELFVGEPLFAGANEHDQLCKIIDIKGDLPSIPLLDRCDVSKIQKMFAKLKDGKYRLIASKGFKPTHRRISDIIDAKMKELSLSEKNIRKEDLPSATDLIRFKDLIHKMLVYDPNDRITPSFALHHPFFRPTLSTASSTDYIKKEVKMVLHLLMNLVFFSLIVHSL